MTGEVELWPENAEAVAVFTKLGTQWRHGPNGPTGLVYDEMWRLLDQLEVPPERQGEIFNGVQVMERAALALMAENRSHG